MHSQYLNYPFENGLPVSLLSRIFDQKEQVKKVRNLKEFGNQQSINYFTVSKYTTHRKGEQDVPDYELKL